jgi:hypothetical protein
MFWRFSAGGMVAGGRCRANVRGATFTPLRSESWLFLIAASNTVSNRAARAYGQDAALKAAAPHLNLRQSRLEAGGAGGGGADFGGFHGETEALEICLGERH